MHEYRNPMTGFKLLELAFSEGFRMQLVPGTEDLYREVDKAFGADRYTYARLDNLKVQQLVILLGTRALFSLPRFRLVCGTHKDIRNRGLTVPFVKQALGQFRRDLSPDYGHEYFLESIVETDDGPSIAVASQLFGRPAYGSVDGSTGIKTSTWQHKVARFLV